MKCPKCNSVMTYVGSGKYVCSSCNTAKLDRHSEELSKRAQYEERRGKVK